MERGRGGGKGGGAHTPHTTYSPPSLPPQEEKELGVCLYSAKIVRPRAVAEAAAGLAVMPGLQGELALRAKAAQEEEGTEAEAPNITTQQGKREPTQAEAHPLQQQGSHPLQQQGSNPTAKGSAEASAEGGAHPPPSGATPTSEVGEDGHAADDQRSRLTIADRPADNDDAHAKRARAARRTLAVEGDGDRLPAIGSRDHGFTLRQLAEDRAPRRRGKAEPLDLQAVLERHALAITTPAHALPWQTHPASAGHEAAVWMAAERANHFRPFVPPRDPAKAAIAAAARAEAKRREEAELARVEAEQVKAVAARAAAAKPLRKEQSVRQKKASAAAQARAEAARE